jgi:hypothetical protein
LQLQQRAASAPATASRDLAQAAALHQSCGCVFGLLVTAQMKTLAEISDNHAIRLVDIAPLGTPADRVTGRPLLNSETSTAVASATPMAYGAVS